MCYWRSYYKNSPKGVSQPKYSVLLLFNDTIDSYKQ
jgi:hypothetical protein